MTLSSSMWTSVSGLLAHGEKMSVIGNNISNINTVGFKGSRMDFQDMMSQSIGTASGQGQVGRGTSIGIVMGNFGQGGFEDSTSDTSMAIQGSGFFSVKPLNSSMLYYTRAGNFDFNAAGYLTDPNGYVLQGWKIDNTTSTQGSSTGTTSDQTASIKGSGVPQDVVLDTLTCKPKHTTTMSVALNLSSDKGYDKCQNEDNPFFALLGTWDANNKDATTGEITPIGSSQYANSFTMTTYDEGGGAHKVTVYFDRVEKSNSDTNIEGLKNNIVWEYIVTMDPSEDNRDFGDIDGGVEGQKKAGILGAGTLQFNTAGQMTDMTAYVPTSNNMDDLSTWVKAPLSNNGFPMVVPNYTGNENASQPFSTSGALNPEANGKMIELNFGLRNTQGSWSGSAPETIGEWATPTNENKVVHSSSSNGTVIKNVAGTPVGGTYSTTNTGVVYDGDVYLIKNGTAGANEVADANGNVYHQANTSNEKASSSQVADTDGWIYEQTEHTNEFTLGGATDTSTWVEYTDSTGANTYYSNDGGKTFHVIASGSDLNATAESPTPTGLKKVPDTSKPVASKRGVSSGTKIQQADANGNLKKAYESYNYTGMDNAERLDSTFTSYGNSSFYVHAKNQNGYTYGDYRSISVSSDGILSAKYSNGVTLELYQLTMANFASTQGLRREGGNLFSETKESGLALTGAAGSGQFGTIVGNKLEQSNVDLSTELVNMISTQRGFQANSKNITTVDTMLETVIGMKR